MSNTPRNLTRNQLAEFLPNARAVRAFEQLLEQVSTLLPSDIVTINRLIQEAYIEAASGTSKAQVALDLLGKNAQTAELNAGAADAKATAALDALSSIAKSLELLANAPVQQAAPSVNDAPPPSRWPGVSELADASVKIPTAGMVLIYDGTLRQWRNATLTAGTNVTVTNADGSITVNAASSAVETHAATSKATPVDADEMPLADSATSFSLKKLTWANLKATLATWINGNLIPASFTTLDSSGLATLGPTAGGNQLRGRSVGYAGSNVWFSTVGDSTERLRFGHYDSSTVAFPTGLVPSQVLAGVSRLDIASRDIAGSSINFRVGAGVPVTVSISATGLAVPTGTLTTLGGATFHTTSTALTNGAGVGAGTITNAPAAGNPTKWIGINDNGTTRYIPAW